MKKLFTTLTLIAVAIVTMAQTPEEKAALKAAQKEAATQAKQGVALRDEVLNLYNANQAEQAKGEKAKQDLIDRNTALIREKSMQANELLLTAIQSGHIEGKKLFDPCKALDDVSTQLLNPELAKASAHEEFDTLLFQRAVDGVCEGCYGAMKNGNAKDAVQGPVVQMEALKMPKLMIYYAYLCFFYSETKNLEGATYAFDQYRNFAQKYPLVANDPSVTDPQYPVAQFAFNLYYTAFQLRNVEACEKFYPMALEYDDEGSHTFVISSLPQLYKEVGDEAKQKAALENIATQFAGTEQGETALQNLLSMAGKDGNEAMQKEADRQVTAYPNSKVANYGKGYSLFAQEKYEDAMQYFKKSVELDDAYYEGYFMGGTCLYRHALENYYKHIDSKKFKSDAEMKAAEDKYVKDYFRQAKAYFEKCQALAPEKTDDWEGPLNNINKNLK